MRPLKRIEQPAQPARNTRRDLNAKAHPRWAALEGCAARMQLSKLPECLLLGHAVSDLLDGHRHRHVQNPHSALEYPDDQKRPDDEHNYGGDDGELDGDRTPRGSQGQPPCLRGETKGQTPGQLTRRREGHL